MPGKTHDIVHKKTTKSLQIVYKLEDKVCFYFHLLSSIYNNNSAKPAVFFFFIIQNVAITDFLK